MFSAERGGADLALLHRALTSPNEDGIQQAECLAAAQPAYCRWGQGGPAAGWEQPQCQPLPPGSPPADVANNLFIGAIILFYFIT